MNSPGGVAICSGADARYFNLLDGLVASLEAADLPSTHAICVLDLGLTLEQRAILQARDVTVVKPQCPFDFAGSDQVPGWFGAMTNRPFLPQHFPGFDTYLWLDADTWVQQSRSVTDLVKAAEDGSIALVIERFGPPRTYRLARPNGVVDVFTITEQGCRNNVEHCYRTCFGDDKAKHARSAITNSGVFALNATSPIWATWSESMIAGVRRGISRPPISFLVEQQALNLGYLEGTIRVRMLPWRYNWNMSTNHPVIDLTRQLLIDPADSGLPVGIVHRNALKETSVLNLQSTDGQTIGVPLGYRAFAARFPLSLAKANNLTPISHPRTV